MIDLQKIIRRHLEPKRAFAFVNECARKSGLSYNALCKEAGVSKSTPWRWFAQGTEPNEATLMAFIMAASRHGALFK